MARGTATSTLLPTLAGLLAAAALLAGTGCGSDETTTTPAATPTVTTPIADISSIGIDPWLKIVGTARSQTREGVSITMEAVAVGTVEDVLGALGVSGEDLGDDWANASAVIAVAFEVDNTTADTITVPLYTNGKVLANDQEVAIDPLFSDARVSIAPGARQGMRVAVPVSRYSAEEIESVRFVLEMSASPSSDTTFDFEVAVP